MSDIDQRDQRVENQTNIGRVQINFVVNPPPPTPLNLHQISEPTMDFVGRTDEIQTLLAVFEEAGQGAVISGVRGMGGVGKTELAKVLAKRLKDRFPDAQIAFNLRGARDDDSTKPATPAEALAHVIRSFYPEVKLPEEVSQLQGLYHSVLDGKRVFLLMDNALNPEQLRPLTPPPDGCALIVTSRHRFLLAGMKEIDLNTLPPGDAQKLLLEICPRIGSHAESLAKLCGYLPLALRLAAFALKTRPTLGAENYLTDLSDEKKRLATLDKYKKWTDEERGIEASLAISYKLLSKQLQRFWRALSVFPGDFDTAAAASVWHIEKENDTTADTRNAAVPAAHRPPQDAETVLGDLHAASVVQWEESTNRFRLHDLARDYARARLSRKERNEDQQSQAAHYAEVLRRTTELYNEGGTSILQSLTLFDREWANIRAGQAWAAAHWNGNKTAARLCSEYPYLGIYCLALHLHPVGRIAWIESALQAARKLGDRQSESNHLTNLGNSYRELGKGCKAIGLHEQALFIARDIGDLRGEGDALGNLGIVYAAIGEPQKAIRFYEQALVIALKTGDRSGEANALGNLGISYAQLTQTDKAIGSYRQQLAIARETGDRRSEGAALGNLGHTYADLGDFRRSIEYGEQALAIARELGDRAGEGTALATLGNACKNLDDTTKGIEYLEKALVAAREIGNRRGEESALGNLGNAYSDLGETEKAIAFYEKALVIAREVGDRPGEGNAHFNLVDELVKLGHRNEATAHAQTAVEIFEKLQSPHASDARALLEQLWK